MRLRTSSATTTAISLSRASRLNMATPGGWPQRHRDTETERGGTEGRRELEKEGWRDGIARSFFLSLPFSLFPPLCLCGSVADFVLFEFQPESRALGMGFDFLQNLYGQGQRAAAFGPVDFGRGSRLNGGDEGFDFGQQRLAFFDSQTFRRDFGQSAGGLRRDQFERHQLLFGVIERIIFVRLKDAQLAQPFAGDAAGGDVGDAAVGEFEPGVGQVDLRRQYRDADRLDFDDFASDQAGDDVKLVYHQIHHHINIERARRKDAHPVGLEKSRAFDAPPQRHERRIEPFDVAGLQDQILRFGRADHLVRFAERTGDRLFDQDVDARFQKGAGNFAVTYGRSRHADRFDLVEQFVVVADETRRVPFGDLAPPGFVDVADGDEFDLF